MRSTCWLLAILAFVLVEGCGSGAATKPETSAGTAPGTSSSSQTQSATTPASAVSNGNVVVVSVADCESEYSLQEKHANDLLEVTGLVENIRNYPDTNQTIIWLEQKDMPVGVYFLVKESEGWARIAPGQTVTLRGQRNTSPDAMIKFIWQVHQAGDNPAPVLTTAEFVKQFQKGGDIAIDDFANQSFYLQGTAINVEKDEQKVIVELTSEGAPAVKASIDGSFYGGLDIRAGQQIALLCSFDPIDGGLSEDGALIELKAHPILSPFPVKDTKYAVAVSSFAQRCASKAEGIKQQKPDFDVTVTDLLKEEAEDRQAFVEKYDEKVVDVAGAVSKFEQSSKQPGIVFAGGDPKKVINAEMLSLPFEECAPGQQVTIRGRVSMGFGTSFSVKDGVIIKTEPSASRELSAVNLAKECVAAGNAFESDWAKKPVKIDGKIVEFQIVPYSSQVTIAADDGYTVIIQFPSESHLKRSHLPARAEGDSVRLQAIVSRIDEDTKVIDLEEGWILPDKK